MRNKTKFFFILTLLCTLCSIGANAQSLLEGKKWSSLANVGGCNGTLQGAAYYNGKVYQFCDAGKQYGVYDVSSDTWTAGEVMNTTENNNAFSSCHFGSACFGPESTKTYTVGSTTTTSTYPLLFVTGKADNNIIIYVIDFQLKTCVTKILFPYTGTRDDMIAAYNFDSKKIYIMGYPADVKGKSPYTVWTYSINSFNSFASASITMPSLTTSETTTTSGVTVTKGIGGPNAEGVQESLACGTLQDCHYCNGYIYYCTSRGSLYNRTEYAKMHALRVSDMTIVNSLPGTNVYEPEGLTSDGTNLYMTTGGGSPVKFYTVVEDDGNTYDNTMNFQPATLGDNGYYQITNASQFVWFKQQVYNGCTTINGKLMNNISMSGITDPFTFYIYNTDATGFEAQYAFRGIFDGCGYTISDISITSTPYNNDGLFPYVKGGTIKNLTVTGNITLSTCTTSAGSNQAVSNVGLIGYMDGGTVTNVDVSGLNIDQTVAGTSGTINKLIGGRSSATITESDNNETTYTHTTDSNGNTVHVYKNGFCVCTDCSKTTDGYYEPATDSDNDTYYEIDNAGKLYWFAYYVNKQSAGPVNINVKLTKDIDLEGSGRGAFPRIGDYYVNASNYPNPYFAGVFDGNGKTISNFYMSTNGPKNNTNPWHIAMFGYTKGTTIKNLKIIGELDILSQSNWDHGSLIGYSGEGTLIEDVTSCVDIKCTGECKGDNYTTRLVGGLVGRLAGTMNRCTYSGTITMPSGVYQGIGGLVGESYKLGNDDCIKNCLFNGTIIAPSTNTSLSVGGIVGIANEKSAVIKNCFVKGTITLAGYASGTNTSGIIMGTPLQSVSISDTYYVTDGVTSTLTAAIGTGTGTVTGTPTEVTTATDLTDNTLLYELQKDAGQSDSKGNWVAGASYPIPGVGDIVSMPEEFTITFKDYDGSELQSTKVKSGNVITAPTPSTRDNCYFGGWSPELTTGATASANATYTAIYYNNGFNVDQTSSTYSTNKYEAPTLNDDGYYEIDNAGKLWYFAKNIATLGYGSNVKLTDNIDMEGKTRDSFPGVGAYTNDITTEFHGVFDGNGKTISNFYMSSSSRCGLFNSTKGTSDSYVTIKNFTIKGEMTVNGTATQRGSIVGFAEEFTKIEDVTSYVNITASGAASQIGGIAGRGSGIINRCRYLGTINAPSSYQAIGGIVGEVYHYKTGDCISNCLFDGTIIANNNDALTLGGIGGAVQEKTGILKNCFSHGTITVSGYNGTTAGIVMGSQGKFALTINDCYYTTDGSDITAAVGTGTGTFSGATPAEVTNASGLTDNTLLYNLQQNAGKDATTNKGNWIAGSSYPIPGVGEIVEKSHHYDDNGYCTDEGCTATQPMGGDFTNGYTIANAGQMATFRDLVSSSDKGTEINAKLTQNISLSNWTENDMIGSKAHPYCGTFDGQGFSITDVNINPSSSTQYVGLFPYVGTSGDNNTDGIAGNIENLSVSGTITNSSYYCNQDVNAPLGMGVIGDMHNGNVINVHSDVTFGCTTATRAQIGGVVGGVHLLSNVKSAKVVIDKCSYTGTIDVNAFDDLGGIIGYIQHNTTISNCLFNGHIKQAYDETVSIPSGSTSSARGTVGLYSQIGGILGYAKGSANTSMTNNLVVGDMETNLSCVTDKMSYDHADGSTLGGSTLHNINAVVGYTDLSELATNTYVLSTMSVKSNGSTAHSDLQLGTIGTINLRTDDTFDRGMVTAELNANTSDNPWGQVLGYQLESWYTDYRTCDGDSPADLYPSPGSTASKPTYKVIRTKNDAESTDTETKYDYVADYFFYDDRGNITPYPTDVASMKVKLIEYTRGDRNLTHSYDMSGYNSFSLPFDLTEKMVPTNAKLYAYKETVGSIVKFKEISAPITKGTPFIMYCEANTPRWYQTIEETTGTEVAIDGGTQLIDETEYGIYSKFNTTIINTGYYKVNYDGKKLVKTVTGSECFPFRIYLKLPGLPASAKSYSLSWDDGATDIEFVNADNEIPFYADRYNVMGQKVSRDTKGIVIVNGKKYMVK